LGQDKNNNVFMKVKGKEMVVKVFFLFPSDEWA
jgi:hypothetical protein